MKEASHRWTELVLATVGVVALLALNHTLNESRTLQQRIVDLSEQRASLVERAARLAESVHSYRSILKNSVLAGGRFLEGQTVKGGSVSINVADLHEPLVLFSIDPECPSCRRLMPFVDSLQREAPCGSRVVSLSVNPEYEWSSSSSLSRIPDYPVVLEPEGLIWKLLPVHRSPTLSIVDRKRGVYEWWRGSLLPADRQDVRRALARLC